MHSNIIGGSSAGRVRACPASVRLAQQVAPLAVTSPYAMEGTACHAILENCLLRWQPPDPALIGHTIEGVRITSDIFYDKLVPAWDATVEVFKSIGVAEFEPEVTVEFATIPGAFGTCDIIATTNTGAVVILDYKFGYNPVSPVENPQLMFYAGAAMEDYKTKGMFTNQQVILGTIQPGTDTQLWETTVTHITGFTLTTMIAVSEAGKPHLEPNPGDHCKWCPALAVCPAALADAEVFLDSRTAENLVAAMSYVERVEAWAKEARKLAQQVLESGNKVPGWKLVQKRATRDWGDEPKIMDKLKRMKKLGKDDYLNYKLKSPAQLEKICKEKKVDFALFDSYITKESSGTTLAAESDPRPAVTVMADREIPETLNSLLNS